MPLINYKPAEGMTARMSGAICVLALGLLGCWQLHGFLTGVGGKSLGSEDERLELPRLDALVENRQDIFNELGKNGVEVSKQVLSLATRTMQETQSELSLDTSDPEVAAKLDEMRRALASGGYQTSSPIDRRARIGEGGTPLRAPDIQRMLKSRVPPTTVPVLGDPQPMAVADIEAQLGKELFAAGATSPFDGLGLRVAVALQQLNINATNVRIQWSTERLPKEGIVLAEAVAKDDPRGIPELAAGTPLADVIEHLPKMGEDALALKHETDGEFIEVPSSVVEDGSILGQPLFEPTLIKLEENITVGGEVVVAAGTILAKSHVDALTEKGIESVLVSVDKVSLEPSAAVGMQPAAPIETVIAAGQRITPELLTLVRRSHDGDFEVSVANTQEQASGDGEEAEVRQRLAGRVVTAAKVLPQEELLADKDVPMTLAEYFYAIADFNKQHAPEGEDVRWRQSIDQRPLMVRDVGDAQSVAVDKAATRNEDLVDYLLADAVMDATTGEEVLPAGHVTGLLDATQIILSLTPDTPTAQFRAWKVTRLNESALAGYTDGPDRAFTFSEFKSEDGTVLIQDGETFTSEELLNHNRIDDIALALDGTELWLLVQQPDGGIARRKLPWFQQDIEKWKKILVLKESIEVEVPRVVVAAGTTLDEESISKILELPEGERGLIVRGACGTSKVSELLPDIFETCDRDLPLTLSADHQLSQAAADLLVAAGIPLVDLKGGSQTVATSGILDLVGKGAVVKALIAVKVGGELLAEKGSELNRELLARCREKSITELTVSGTKVDKPLGDVEPGDIAADVKGIEIVEPFLFRGEEVGKNEVITEDIVLSLSDLRDSGELAFPITLESADPESRVTIDITSEDDWGKLQQAIPVSYFLKESINLNGPLAKTLTSVGTVFSVTWAGLMAVAILLLFLFLLVKVVNHPRLSDLLIDTQSEMQKVSWPTREDILGSSQVVIFTVVCLAVFMLLADIMLDWIISFILTKN